MVLLQDTSTALAEKEGEARYLEKGKGVQFTHLACETDRLELYVQKGYKEISHQTPRGAYQESSAFKRTNRKRIFRLL